MPYKKRLPIIVGVGDMIGFSEWEKNLINPENEFYPLMNSFDKLIDEFEIGTEYFTKRLGDGVMIVAELNGENHPKKTAHFLNQCWHLLMKIQKMLDNDGPRGFRIRFDSGDAWKKENSSGIDYVGRHINRAFKALKLDPMIPFGCYQNVKNIIDNNRTNYHHFKFTPFNRTEKTYSGLTKEEVKRWFKVEPIKK